MPKYKITAEIEENGWVKSSKLKENDNANTIEIRTQNNIYEIYINNQYNGLYLLTERLDFSSLSLDKGGALFKEPCVFRTSISSEMSESVYYYHQKYN